MRVVWLRFNVGLVSVGLAPQIANPHANAMVSMIRDKRIMPRPFNVVKNNEVKTLMYISFRKLNLRKNHNMHLLSQSA